MIFTPTKLPGAFIIDLEQRQDDRGFFARTWCAKEMAAHGLATNLAQANMSLSRKRGTLRGMHFQIAPHQEDKIVRCTRGALHDVIIDLRLESATFKQWIGVDLTVDNYRSLYVPKGFGHGFVTLTDDTEAAYFVSEFYAPGAEGGVRYNDPAFDIHWPAAMQVISEKDANWPDFA
jgi:dTDP-4-dehydrorhamnose 3,5-epimerase